MEQEKRKTKLKNLLKFKRNSMLIIVMFTFLCLFSGTSLARETERPKSIIEEIIEEKAGGLNDKELGAGRSITVTGTYNSTKGTIKLTWTTSGTFTEYKVYMQKQRSKRAFTEEDATHTNSLGDKFHEYKIKTTKSKGYTVPKSITVDKMNITLADEVGPYPPVIQTKVLENGKGYSVKVNSVSDMGTAYRFRVNGKYTVENERYFDGDYYTYTTSEYLDSDYEAVTITSGVKEYQYIITQSPNSTFSSPKKATTVSALNTAINEAIKDNFDNKKWKEQYLYVRVKDNAGNYSGIVMKKLENIMTLSASYNSTSDRITISWEIKAATPGDITITLYKGKTAIDKNILTTKEVEGRKNPITKASKKGSERIIVGKDTSAPNEPTIPKPPIRQNHTGYDIQVKDNGDNGTKYEYVAGAYIKVPKEDSQIDLVFLIDLSGSMVDFRNVFTDASGVILTMAKKVLQEGRTCCNNKNGWSIS